MNIKIMKDTVLKFSEEYIVDKEFMVLGTTINLLGFGLLDTKLMAYFVSKASMEENPEEGNISKKRRKGTLTNRESCLEHLNKRESGEEHCMRSISISNKKYEFGLMSSSVIGDFANEESGMIIFHYIQAGVSFGSLEDCNLEELYLTTATFEGEYKKIPFKKSPLDTMEIQFSDYYYRVPVKKKIMLTIGEGKKRKYSFISEHNGESYEFYINNANFFDPWKDIEERSESPEYQKMFTKEQLNEMKETMTRFLLTNCPKGKQYVIVEYESGVANLEIYSSDYLKEKVVTHSGSSSAMGYLFKSDTPFGKHGLKSRITCIQYPVDKEITDFPIEIISAQIGEKIEDISLGCI